LGEKKFSYSYREKKKHGGETRERSHKIKEKRNKKSPSHAVKTTQSSLTQGGRQRKPIFGRERKTRAKWNLEEEGGRRYQVQLLKKESAVTSSVIIREEVGRRSRREKKNMTPGCVMGGEKEGVEEGGRMGKLFLKSRKFRYTHLTPVRRHPKIRANRKNEGEKKREAKSLGRRTTRGNGSTARC